MSTFWGRDERCCTKRCGRATCLVVFSLFTLALGIVIVFGMPIFVSHEIKQMFEVYNGSATYPTWVMPKEPVFMSYYVFNVTNVDDVLNGERPNVQEFGPFTYLEQRPRENITFFDNGTVKWVQPKTYIQFVNQSIAADDEVEVCTINFPIMFLGALLEPVVQKLSLLPSLVRDILEIPKILDALAGEDTLICRTPRQIIWGLKDRVFWRIGSLLEEEGQKVQRYIPMLVKPVEKEAAEFIASNLLKIAALIPKGGIISIETNGTADGTWATFTGTKDMSLINTLDLYDNARLLKWWNSHSCNMINGTDGSQFKPNVKKSDKLFVFTTELCRSIYLIYSTTIHLKGIPLYRFTPPPKLFDNGTNYGYLKGFCVPHCWPSGTQDISSCQGGLPLMMSSPHFLYADHVYRDNVTGMHPNFEHHATFVDIEPNTGIMLQGNKRLQLNVRVSNYSFLPGGYNLRECFLPLFYANESAVVSDTDAARLRHSMLLPLMIASILQWSLICIGTLVFAITITYNVRRYLIENERVYIPLQPIPIPAEGKETDLLIN